MPLYTYTRGLRLAMLLGALLWPQTHRAQSLPAEARQLHGELVATWLVSVADDPRLRVLRIQSVAPEANGIWPLDAVYGWQGSKGARVHGTIAQSEGTKRLELLTPADSKIVATESAAGVFVGTMETKGGATKSVRLVRLAGDVVAAKPPAIHMVVMGGNDCPPCVAWRAFEFPKLQQMPAFKSIQYSYVIKGVESPVPPVVFLPDEVKPYKAQLDEAGSRRKGSPQVAIIVNGKVYDYYFGTRTAQEIESMLLAIQATGKYPFKRCLKVNLARQCEVPT